MITLEDRRRERRARLWRELGWSFAEGFVWAVALVAAGYWLGCREAKR